MRRCRARYMGRVAYADASTLQQQLVRSLIDRSSDEGLLLLEHPHVLTLGRGADRANLLLNESTRSRYGIGIHETGRGGAVRRPGSRRRSTSRS